MTTDAMSLPDAVVALEHTIEDVDLLDEALIAHRHATNDTGRQAALRLIGDDLTEAWAALLRARVRLEQVAAG